jgi:hypothetical protein
VNGWHEFLVHLIATVVTLIIGLIDSAGAACTICSISDSDSCPPTRCPAGANVAIQSASGTATSGVPQTLEATGTTRPLRKLHAQPEVPLNRASNRKDTKQRGSAFE